VGAALAANGASAPSLLATQFRSVGPFSSKMNRFHCCPIKDEFASRGLKLWRNVPVFFRIWDIARWAGSYIAN
jgi:hypothetical protein